MTVAIDGAARAARFVRFLAKSERAALRVDEDAERPGNTMDDAKLHRRPRLLFGGLSFVLRRRLTISAWVSGGVFGIRGRPLSGLAPVWWRGEDFRSRYLI
jgi:hypothetical protein